MRTPIRFSLMMVAGLLVPAAVPAAGSKPPAGAATEAPGPPPANLAIVTVKAAPVTVAAGGAAEAKVTVVIHEGYMLLGHKPPNKFAIPLMLSFDGQPGLHAETPVMPPDKVSRDPDSGGVGDPVYEGTIVIKVPVKADPAAAAGDYTLKGRLRYHPMKESGFGPVGVEPVNLPVHITAAKKKKD